MHTGFSPPSEDVFSVLKRLARKRAAVERCEMCSRELGPDHCHLVEPATHKLVCACEACSILFEGHHSANFKRVPRSGSYLPDFQMTDAQWEALMVPIEMAFFFKSSPLQRLIGLYPSPAGAVESTLPLATWDDIVGANPVLGSMEPDVVALLVNRIAVARGSQRGEYFLAPIDKCYELVGLIRGQWRGLSGGTEVWRDIDQFFADLKKRSAVYQGAAHA